MTSGEQIRVLIVEDEEIAQTAHAAYLRRLDGFTVVDIVSTGADALQVLKGDGIDLILLDIHLPDIIGIELCRRIRAAGIDVDVIAITAARDLAMVRASIAAGIVQYLIKPFAFPAFAERLESYRRFRASVQAEGSAASQVDVDLALAALRGPVRRGLAKGLTEETLQAVVALLREADAPLSALEVATRASISRVTARRYLEHLADSGSASREPRYGAPGRPVLEYRLT